jgi:putative glutathione S-transferase
VSAFTLGSEARAGAFHRQASRFRDRVTVDGSSGYRAETGRYHLYVSWACPWAHRTIIGRRLKGLEGAITLSVVDPLRDDRGWAFTGGDYVDPLNRFAFLSEAYLATDPSYEGRHSVPVLWDRETRRIVNNESGEILRMLDSGWGGLAERDVVLCPEPLRAQIDALNDRIYDTLNNGVYKAGFATEQDVYAEAARGVFATLGELEARLADRRYLFGPLPTEADWRLFTTLVRFDAVYHGHFKCNLRRLVDHPNLWGYVRDLYAVPGVAETVRVDEIKRHYYLTHPMINPNRIVPIGPQLDFAAPHGREALVGG